MTTGAQLSLGEADRTRTACACLPLHLAFYLLI